MAILGFLKKISEGIVTVFATKSDKGTAVNVAVNGIDTIIKNPSIPAGLLQVGVVFDDTGEKNIELIFPNKYSYGEVAKVGILGQGVPNPPSTYYSITKDNTATINVYYDSVTGDLMIQNKTARILRKAEAGFIGHEFNIFND